MDDEAHTMKMAMTFALGALLLLMAPLAGNVQAAGMNYQLSLSYVDGFDDLADAYECSWEAERLDEGYTYADADITVWPVGISFQPYYQWDSGLQVGAGVGPIMYFWGDDLDHFQLPIRGLVGYVFNPSDPVSFYVRGGLSYHIASGDYVEGSNIGFVGGAGVELFKSDHAAIGIEAMYDSAEVDIEDYETGRDEGIKAAEFSLSLFFVFR